MERLQAISRLGSGSATRSFVGGFVIRMALLFGVTATVVATTGLDLAGFVLWLVTFYFALVLVEAWILARRSRQENR